MTADRRTLYQAAIGHWKFYTLAAMAKLGVADALVAEPLSVQQLAEKLNLNEDRLERALRALASAEIFTRLPDGRFTNNDASHYLRSDIAGSLKDMIIMYSRDWITDAWLKMPETLTSKQKQTPFHSCRQQEVYDYLGSHPDEQQLFDQVMQQLSGYAAESLVDLIPLNGHETVTDLGGGSGSLLLKLLAVYPDIQCTLFEQPSVIEKAKQRPEIQSHAPHISLVAGNLFETISQHSDIYILKSILHSFDKAHNTQILQQCRQAMKPDSRLIIIDHIVGDTPQHNHSNWYDLLMMQIGGREVNQEQFSELLTSCDLEVTDVRLQQNTASVIEAKVR